MDNDAAQEAAAQQAAAQGAACTADEAQAASVAAQEQERLQREEAAVEGLTFRQAMTELGQIVSDLESNTLELEESLAKYERGIALLRHLRSNLAQAQQKVDVLMGELEQAPDDATVDTTLQKA